MTSGRKRTNLRHDNPYFQGDKHETKVNHLNQKIKLDNDDLEILKSTQIKKTNR